MMSIVAARVDVARFGFEAFRASPRQADLIILSGRVSIKMAPIVRRIYDQMLEPKWAIAMGACSSSMGVFNNYAIVPADKFMPVDVHVPGCPPRPEALMHGILKLRKMILEDPDMGWREGFDALMSVHGVDYYPEEPRFGVHYELLDMGALDRLTVKLRVPLDNPHVPSVTPDWPTANHQEREIYDMFGVIFDGHPDMRRI